MDYRVCVTDSACIYTILISGLLREVHEFTPYLIWVANSRIWPYYSDMYCVKAL